MNDWRTEQILILSIGVSLLGAGLGRLLLPLAALVGGGVGSLLLLWAGVRRAGTYACFLGIFLGFHLLYGLSGPVAVLAGQDLPSVFGTPYRTNEWLTAFCLSSAGLGLALLLTRSVTFRSDVSIAHTAPESARRQVRAGVLLCILASTGELINLQRAGGLRLIVEGKAAYQSATTELLLTLPSEQFALLGIALMAIGFANRPLGARSRPRWLIGLGTVALLPLLAIMVALGQRGLLLSWLLVGVVAVSLRRPPRVVSLGAGGLLLFGYLVAGLLYANRAFLGIAIATGDWSLVREQGLSSERIATALNPASSEFGTPFGNFGDYLRGTNSGPRLGTSYIVALASPVPRFLFPGTKPQQLSLEFRDQLFPLEARLGSIAGTGFSSILEAYIDFGILGPFLMYFLFGVLMMWAERRRSQGLSLPASVIYLLMIPTAVAFHRSGFDLLVGNAAFAIALSGLVWLVSPGAATRPRVSSSELA